MLSTSVLLSLIPALTLASPLAIRQSPGLGYIHPLNELNVCLNIDGPLADGTPVTFGACNLNSKEWTIKAGNNPNVKVSGSTGGSAGLGYCLDVGSQFPANGTPLKIWSCIAGNANQAFYLTDDDHIAVTGGNGCLDIGNNGQVWQCFGGNTNQLFEVDDTATYPPPPTAPSSHLVHPNGDTTRCLTVNNGYAGVGTSVAIVGCGSANDTNLRSLQTWNFVKQAESNIALNGTTLNLDAGSNPGNGVGAKVWTALDVPQQKFYYTADNHIALYGGSVCLDVVAESGPTPTKPYGTLKDVQYWDCSGPDPNQIWTTTDL
jgi:hypothetical protein